MKSEPVFEQKEPQKPKKRGKLRKGFVKAFIKEQFGPESKEDKEKNPFLERDEDEQAEMLYQVQSLVAERKDLVRSILKYEESEGKEGEPRVIYEIKVLPGGRRQRVPKKVEGLTDKKRKGAVKESQKRLEEVKEEIKTLGEVPGLREAYEKKITHMYFLTKVAQRAQELESRNEEIKAESEGIIQEGLEGDAGAVTGVQTKHLEMLEEELEGNKEKLASVDQYEGGHEMRRFMTIKKYADAMARGWIVEMPSAKKVIDEGLENMRNHQPFLLAGHLGSGKTEMARHMAKIFMIENGVDYDPDTEQDYDKLYQRLEPEFFSGGDEASIYDLVGKLKLVGKSSEDKNLLTKRVEELQEFLQEKKYDVPKEKLVEVILGKSDVTETVFGYGPLGRAIRDGRPIIIDEINLIPPDVIGRINQVLLKGVGSKERLQENGEESLEIKPGFTVLATCNLGEQYEGIKAVNAAFKSRWVGKEVGYPQVEETYDLILAQLVRKDRVRMHPDFPAESFDKLIDLSIAVREIQEIFSGDTEGQRFMAMAHSAAAESRQLEKSVVSTRDLVRKIIGVWKKGNFKESLDTIIARNILAAEVWSKDDQKFLSEIFLRRGFFQDWDQKAFEKAGIKTVHQKELDALQVALDSAEFKESDARFGEMQDSAHERASLIKADLLIGTKRK